MKIQKTVNNQYIVTIPKALAIALDLSNGSILEFSFGAEMQLKLKKVETPGRATRMRVQKTNQYIVTIPKAFAESLDFDQGTKVSFRLNQDFDLVMKKED